MNNSSRNDHPTIREMPTPCQPWQVRPTVPGFRGAGQQRQNPSSESRVRRVDPRVEPDDE